MSIPSKCKDEDPEKFMSRCMSDDTMNREYPSENQRYTMCMSRACYNMNHIEAMSFQLSYNKEFGTYKYKDPKTNEVYEYDRKGVYRKNGRVLILVEE